MLPYLMKLHKTLQNANVLILTFKVNVDIIVVLIHFGQELRRRPFPYQLHITNHLMSLGVQVIIGAHPHVLQPHCLHDNKLVAYSLGNFLFYPKQPLSGMSPVNVFGDL